ncbi:MAG: hypothetical protein M1819_003605 [Sarea resinae]|nr:MAG: hypothetical protein M1819_003605 [Sarea resinae]
MGASNPNNNSYKCKAMPSHSDRVNSSRLSPLKVANCKNNSNKQATPSACARYVDTLIVGSAASLFSRAVKSTWHDQRRKRLFMLVGKTDYIKKTV